MYLINICETWIITYSHNTVHWRIELLFFQDDKSAAASLLNILNTGSYTLSVSTTWFIFNLNFLKCFFNSKLKKYYVSKTYNN